ncbi:hypothetical protein [Lacrimispora sphenoides]|uniref:hypothetical protein n=1 Tax=Lacrimispora sphenoides TaxID=29370 RepID=UPI00140D5AE7|nr:hypothetical protein [Lacrimispora sphenoides]
MAGNLSAGIYAIPAAEIVERWHKSKNNSSKKVKKNNMLMSANVLNYKHYLLSEVCP